ncbi:Ltp family lipoprotein [Rhodococcoides yunnanense]|jgi:hypothetical protein|uniref:Ltp family lipoprotein n=1 Tax=Rhodococcoides yunnanense TaxID=278209 RepID=UPI0022B10CDA|nr:Ltp family lipoprotein [Rhodococcus yunnanensis]MCZ4279020.1 Ltp family lipoprotein [Rhodococcus yunnanensis]
MTMPAGWFADPEGSGQLRWWDGQQWTSSLQPPPYSAQTPNDQQPGGPPSKKWPWVVGGVVGILVFIGIIGALGSGDDTSDVASVQETTARATTERVPVTSTTSVPSTTATASLVPAPPPLNTETVAQAPPVTVQPVEPASPQSGMTGGQRNAVRSANSYLEYTSFSRQGLIEQLEYEDYSTEDATFAVDYVAPDWNEQAAKSAESYLEYTSFSRQGLIDQLVYEGFTYEQAQYGVDQTGL